MRLGRGLLITSHSDVRAWTAVFREEGNRLRKAGVLKTESGSTLPAKARGGRVLKSAFLAAPLEWSSALLAEVHAVRIFRSALGAAHRALPLAPYGLYGWYIMLRYARANSLPRIRERVLKSQHLLNLSATSS